MQEGSSLDEKAAQSLLMLRHSLSPPAESTKTAEVSSADEEFQPISPIVINHNARGNSTDGDHVEEGCGDDHERQKGYTKTYNALLGHIHLKALSEGIESNRVNEAIAKVWFEVLNEVKCHGVGQDDIYDDPGWEAFVAEVV